MPEQDYLSRLPLFPEETEEAIRARWNAWANEGLAPEDERWTDTLEGSHFHTQTQGGVMEAARIYDLMGTEMVAAASPLWAWGEYLDDHGEVQDVYRLPATPATGEATFTGPGGTVIAAGTTVGVEPTEPDEESAEFEVTTGAVIPGDPDDTGQVTVPIQAETAGVIGNASAGAITEVLTPLAGVSVTNEDPTVGGTEPETDEGLRGRVLAEYIGVVSGNRAYYERLGRAAAGVGRVTVIPLWNGPGTVLVIVSDPDGNPVSQDVVDDLQASLDPEPQQGSGTALIGAHVTVQTAAVLDVDVAGDVECEEGYSLDGSGGSIAVLDEIERAVRRYIDSVPSGGEVVRSQVTAAIATVAGVHDVANVTLNGAAQNIQVSANPAEVPALDDLTLEEVVL